MVAASKYINYTTWLYFPDGKEFKHEVAHPKGLTGMTAKVEPLVRTAYFNTLQALRRALPSTVNLLHLEKQSFPDIETNKWVLKFYIEHHQLTMEVSHEVKGKVGVLSKEVYSECPHDMLLTKVRVFL